MVIAIDTSGSVDDVMLAQSAIVVNEIVDVMKPERVTVIYCDSRVKGQEVFERGDPVTLKLVGGGGTRFQPVFDAVRDSGEDPVCLVYLTDLDGRAAEEPHYPVLWVTTSNRTAPWGETVDATT